MSAHQQHEPAEPTRASILIVDDDESTRRTLALIFARRGYECQAAASGAEALQMVQRRAFDLALLDIRLPDVEGTELLAPLKAQCPDMAVLIETGFASLNTAVRAMDQGAAGYLTKPLDMDATLARISDVLEKQRLLLENRLQTTALEAAAIGIVITDRAGHMQWCNPAFAEMTGYGREEMLGQNLRFLKSGAQLSAFYKELWDTILAGRTWLGELLNRRKDGVVYTEEQTITPVKDERGEVTHFIAIKRDITARKRAEQLLRQHSLELEALNKAEKQARNLAETLSAASVAMAQTLELETVLSTLLEFVSRIAPYDYAAVVLLEGESRLVVRAARSMPDCPADVPVPQPGAVLSDLERLPHVQALLATRRTVMSPDQCAHPSPSNGDAVHGLAASSTTWRWLDVPLVAGHIIGYCELGKAGPGTFAAEHIHAVEALVSQATVAVQNAWLFEQVRAGREHLQALSRRLVDVQEAERRYIARELHDEAGQALTSLMFGLKLLERECEVDGTERIVERIAELKRVTDGISENLHRLAMDLRPASLEHLGLIAALRQYLEGLAERSGLLAQFKAVGFDDQRLPMPLETAIYRIVQEALTNVVRYAHATRVDVLLERQGERVVAVVEDDGVGFDPEAAMARGHLGLLGMHERAEMLGGTLALESAPGAGTTVVVEVKS